MSPTTALRRLASAVSCLFLLAPVADSAQPAATPAASANGSRPNILIILADDLGYSDLGIFGGEIPTPNLDDLARAGMLLTQFYSGQTCSPTRAMLLSGMDQHRAGLGVMGVPTREDQKGKPGYEGYLNQRVASLAELFGDAGYNTYMTGKWHLGDTVETGPRARGFRRSFVSLDGAAHLGGWDWRGPLPARYRDGDDLVQVGADFYSTRFYTGRMLQYIEQDRTEGKPFLAYLAYTAPHWPLQAPDESIARFKGHYDAGYEALYAARLERQKQLGLVPKDLPAIDNARFRPRWSELDAQQRAIESRRMEIYAAMVSDLDVYVGKVIDYLKSTGQFDNTFILFMSDNGAEPGRRDLQAPISGYIGKQYDHSLANMGRANSYIMYGANWASASSTPWFRNKGTAFEGGNHVPAFVRYPRLVKQGSRSDAMGTVKDVLPTLLELAGTRHPGTSYKGREVLPPQGVSLLPVLSGRATQAHPSDAIFGWELFGHRSVRQGDWKIVWDQSAPQPLRRWQLFNLANDREEQHDLAAQQPARRDSMIELWNQFARENGVIY